MLWPAALGQSVTPRPLSPLPPAPSPGPPAAGARGDAAERAAGRPAEPQRRGEAVSAFEPCLPAICFYIAARCLPLLCSQPDRAETALAAAWTLLYGRIS